MREQRKRQEDDRLLFYLRLFDREQDLGTFRALMYRVVNMVVNMRHAYIIVIRLTTSRMLFTCILGWLLWLHIGWYRGRMIFVWGNRVR